MSTAISAAQSDAVGCRAVGLQSAAISAAAARRGAVRTAARLRVAEAAIPRPAPLMIRHPEARAVFGEPRRMHEPRRVPLAPPRRYPRRRHRSRGPRSEL